MATVALSGIITPTNVVTATSTTTLTNKTIATPTITGVTTFSAGTAALPALTTSGDTNTGIFFPAADSVATTVGGAEGTRLTSTGLGVGTTTPDVLSRGYGTLLSVSNTGSTGAAIQINGGSVGYPALELGRSGVRKVLLTAQSTVTEFGNLEAVPLVIKTNDVERARFNTTGAFVFNGGTTTADGIGITFPASQSASSDANTLDDYEEGTWTPTDGSGASLSFTGVTGNYTKIGNQVTAWTRLTYPTTASTAGAQLNGLPFVVSSTLSAAGGGMMAYKTTTSVFSIRATGSGILFQDSTGGQPTNAALSTGTFIFATTYFV